MSGVCSSKCGSSFGTARASDLGIQVAAPNTHRGGNVKLTGEHVDEYQGPRCVLQRAVTAIDGANDGFGTQFQKRMEAFKLARRYSGVCYMHTPMRHIGHVNLTEATNLDIVSGLRSDPCGICAKKTGK